MQSVMRARLIRAAAWAALLGGCGASNEPRKPDEAKAASAEASFVDAPAVIAATPFASGVRLEGMAAPKARIELAPMGGGLLLTVADLTGRWVLAVPAADEARLFNLSALSDGRRLQAEGYLIVAASGKAAMLRAGAGAHSLAAGTSPRLTAVDFDREGGAIISGAAPPQSAVSIRIDGRPGPVGAADASGRFSLSLSQPLASGAHQVQMLGDNFEAAATVTSSPAAPLSQAPFRAAGTPEGLRVDWMTPGGGLQSTWILD